MDLLGRKLLYIQEKDPSSPVPQSGISSNTSSADFSRLNRSGHSEDYGLSSYQPLDSSIALPILVLLAALFFMAFFSIYNRRFSEDDDSEYRLRRRRSEAHRRAAKGLDTETLESIPVYGYDGGGGKQGIVDCAICLSEFEKGEGVKAIPFCGHVFHVGCIDTWLQSHVTCPLCRTPKLFPEEKVAVECDARGEDAVGSTVEEVDTWRDEGGCVVQRRELRRSSSCSCMGLVGERVMLSRTPSL